MEQYTSSTLQAVNRLFREADAIHYQIASRLNLSLSAFWILYIMADSSEEWSQQELSDELHLSKQTLNSSIHRLRRNGWLSLERTSEHSLKKVILLTPSGHRFVEQCMQPLLEAERSSFVKMDPDEQKRYLELSQKYVACLKSTADALTKKEQLPFEQ